MALRGGGRGRGHGRGRGRGRGSWFLLRLEVALPQVDAHAIRLVCVVAPELPRRELDRVAGLPGVVLAVSIGVGQAERPVQLADDAESAARIPRQACVTLGMDVARPHPIAQLETRLRSEEHTSELQS